MNKRDEIIRRVKGLTPAQEDKILEVLKKWQSGRQREYSRHAANSDVDMALKDLVIQTSARDISAGGIFINASGNFEVGQKVTIVFTIPGYGKPFKLKGRIVRVEKKGLAIQFEELTSYLKTILDDAICKSSRGD